MFFLLQFQSCFLNCLITRCDLLLPSSHKLLLLKRRARCKGFLLSSSSRKTSFKIFFDFIDSVKWLLNYFPEKFRLQFAATLLYSLACFLPPEERTLSKIFCKFDGTKLNSLFDYVKKWFFLQDLEYRLEIQEER